MTLADLKIGQDAVLRTIGGQGELRHHLLDMGLTPGTEVTLRKVAPMGDPIEVELRGYELTLRLDDAAKIEVENVHETDRAARSEERHTAVPHPGVGELRKAPSYHDRKSGAEIPKGQPLRFALAGNQNCGKTTLFNQLTGSNQHVGNFPGVTVDRKDGVIRGHAEATVTDLPGIYSLSPYSSEEIVTRDFLLNTHPDGIINIVDASNIERNLYLTMQLMELNIPLVLALNMMDEVRANGGTIMVNELEELLGVPVVPISAAKNEGIDELVEHALHVARHRETPGRIDFCDAGDGAGGAVHRCVHAVSHLIEDHAARTGLPLRFAATKLVEGDTLIESALDLDANETELLGHTIAELESETGLDREAALADMRFNFIERLCDKTVVRPGESREHKRSVAIDRILTGHGVNHKQGFNRVNRRMDLFDLVHHRFVNVQTTSGIHQQHVVEFQFGFFQRRVNDIYRLLTNIRREEINAHLLCQRLKLFDCRRAINVGRNHQHFLLVLLAQELTEFTNAGCFTGTLQARHQHDRRRLRRQVQGLVLFAHRRNQFVTDDFDELLPRRQALINFMTNRFLFYAIDKLTHYRQSDIRLQQRHAHFAQRIFYVVFSEASTATDIAQRARQTIG